MKTKTTWGALCDEYASAIDAKDVENLELIRFEGSAARAQAEDIRLENVRLVK